MIVHAHLACTSVAAGAVECAVVVERDRAAVWQAAYGGHVAIGSELPFGGTPEVAMELAPESTEGARWIAPRAFAAGEFLPCAVTTVRAELDGDGGALWRGSIELPRRGCAHPRVTARVTCERAIEGVGPPSFDCGPDGDSFCTGETDNVIDCRLSIDRDGSSSLRLYARRGDEPVEVSDFDGNQTGAAFAADGTRRSLIRFAITSAEGAILWRGHGH